MNKELLINQLTQLSKSLYDGDYVLNIISKFNGNWEMIFACINKGYMVSDAIKIHPFLELTEFENSLLAELIHCGELGGIMEITIDRAIVYLKNAQPYPLSVKGYLHTVGLMLSCGVPILKSIRSVPINVTHEYLKEQVYTSIKDGNEFYTVFKNYLTNEEYKGLQEAEYTGSLPEFLITLKD